jgi:hypothetical protein
VELDNRKPNQLGLSCTDNGRDTFFIGEDGIIQQKVAGAFPNKEAMEKYVSEIVS